MTRMVCWMSAALLVCAGSVTAAAADPGVAQDSSRSRTARVVTSANGTVIVPPAKARFDISVKTSAPTAAAAGAENATLSKAVRDALSRTALEPAAILGSRLVVGPRWSYDESRRGRRTGYDVVNTLSIETRRLGDLGQIIDAALSAGATSISEADFTPEDIDQARRDALARAVATARADAEAIAKAAGGELGDLLLLSTERTPSMRDGFAEIVVTARKREAAEPTELVPEDIKVYARVEAEWQFVPAGASRR